LREAESWLYGDGENANKSYFFYCKNFSSKYVEKKKELENLCEQVKNRFIEYQNIPDAFKELD